MNDPLKDSEIRDDCKKCILSIEDALSVLDSKWKLYILISLKEHSRRFNELSKGIRGITPKILSKELRDLESNQLIIREVRNLFPPHVEYTITEHGLSLGNVLASLRTWGESHRKRIMV